VKLTLYLNPQTRGPQDDVDNIETSIRHAVRATHAGFDGVCLTEHHASNYNTYGDNFMLAAHLAPQVRPGTTFQLAAAVPALHNPIRLAQQVNLLDILCRGRVIIGMAAGANPKEFVALGADPTRRHELMLRNIEVMERALDKQQDDPPYAWATDTESGTLELRVMPTAYYRTRPRFARAAVSDESVIWAGRHGWYLFTGRALVPALAQRFRLYRDTLVDSGYDDETVRDRMEWASITTQLVIRERHEDAMKEAARFARMRFARVGKTFGQDRSEFSAALGSSSPDPLEFVRTSMLAGSPEAIVEQLHTMEEAGIRHVQVNVQHDDIDRPAADRALELFIETVLPHFPGTSESLSQQQRASSRHQPTVSPNLVPN
jgi:alkanesulfonate monooxygenase SsuD/methylene tetrahydromethanopterin reductase-like flavin-dependent oxidoreductase (luciferase family)